MKVQDFIKRAIFTYPGLYLYPDYYSSAIRVLDYAFGAIDNGMEWANTKDPRHGGYICDPKMRRLGCDWVRCYDKSYGKEKIDVDLSRYFEEPLIEISSFDNGFHNIFVGFRDEFDKAGIEMESSEMFPLDEEVIGKNNSYAKINGEECFIDWNVAYGNSNRLSKLDGNDSDKYKYYGFRPYDLSEEYSLIFEEDPSIIQDDWRMAAIWWLSECIEYCCDLERYRATIFRAEMSDEQVENRRLLYCELCKKALMRLI